MANLTTKTYKSKLKRYYGYFSCSNCNHSWQSSRVYCQPETRQVNYQQKCKRCKKSCMAHRVEIIRCNQCGSTADHCLCRQGEHLDSRVTDRACVMSGNHRDLTAPHHYSHNDLLGRNVTNQGKDSDDQGDGQSDVNDDDYDKLDFPADEDSEFSDGGSDSLSAYHWEDNGEDDNDDDLLQHYLVVSDDDTI